MLQGLQKHKTVLLIIISIFVGVLLMYGHYIKLYFSQDDFFHFRVSTSSSSLLELFSFKPYAERDGIYFYRPIFREFLFNLFYKLFGFNHFYFRFLQFLIHFTNIVLTLIVIFKITKYKFIAVVSAIFFGLVATNVGILSYLAGGVTVSGMLMFFLSSIVCYLTHLETSKHKYKLLSFLFFLGALMSHETAATLPVLNILLNLYKGGVGAKNLKKAILDNIFYFIPVAILVCLEVFVIGLPTSEMNYGLNISILKLLNSYFWYGLWATGIPEMLLDFVGPGVSLNPNLMKYWGNYFNPIFISFGVFCFLGLLYLKHVLNNKLFILFVLWFFIGLTPVVFLPFHRQYHYLEVVLPAVGALVGIFFVEIFKRNKLVGTFFAVSLFVMNFASIKLADITHWSINRSKKAEIILAEFKEKYPVLPNGAVVYFKNDPNEPYFNEDWGNSSKQASIILSGSDAIQMLYGDRTIKVYYEDIAKPFSENIYEFQVSIN